MIESEKKLKRLTGAVGTAVPGGPAIKPVENTVGTAVPMGSAVGTAVPGGPALKPEESARVTGYQPAGGYQDAGLSDGDKAAVEDLQRQWQEANAAGDKEKADAIHREAEAIRAKSGYSGGADGSEYVPLASGSGAGQSGSQSGALKAPEAALPQDYSEYILALDKARREQTMAQLRAAWERDRGEE